MTPLPTLSICFAKKRKKKKILQARLKRNGLISKILELSESCEIVFIDVSLSCMMEPRSNSVRYTLKKILYTIHFFDISIVLLPPCGALFYKRFMLHWSSEKTVIHHDRQIILWDSSIFGWVGGTVKLKLNIELKQTSLLNVRYDIWE